MPGVTPDSWIDHLYAQDMLNQGQRGFVLARVGSSNGFTEQVYPAGPWSDHTSTIAFTGDAWGTWTQLAAEVALTPDEATIGEPYVSDDIGSYLGPPPTQTAQDPPDLYDRWVQFGTFQPILRLHSDNLDRLPWEFPEPVSGITENFLRLREALIPYTYTLAYQAYSQALPIAQPLYLQYPDQAEAYSNPEEYLYGIRHAGGTGPSRRQRPRTTVWFPPAGGSTTSPAPPSKVRRPRPCRCPSTGCPCSCGQVGIVPEQQNHVETRQDLDIKVYAGSSGSFDLYDDSGTGTRVPERAVHRDTDHRLARSHRSPESAQEKSNVTIAAASGHYPGEPHRIDYDVEMIDLERTICRSLSTVRPLADNPEFGRARLVLRLGSPGRYSSRQVPGQYLAVAHDRRYRRFVPINLPEPS